MARTVKDAKLDSRNARDKLKPRARPYYKMLIPGTLSLGYRRRQGGRGAQGRWLARCYVGMDDKGVGRYKEKDLGLADDFRDADGVAIFSYAQAQARALEWRPDKHADGQKAPTGPLTVADALTNYLKAREHQGNSVRDDRLRADLHILPSLGSELIENLTTARLRRWLADIAKLPPRVRQKVGATAPAFRLGEADDGDETERRRLSTANRTLTILKAALNHAFDEGDVQSNVAWGRRLKPFKKADAPRIRFLTKDEARRLVNASDVEFRPLVQAALFSGARFGELARLKCSDFSVDSGTLAIWQSKTGKPRHIHLSDEAARFFREIIAGRAGDEIMLRKANGRAWAKSEQARPMLAAVQRAKISPPISFHVLRHSFASLLVQNGAPLNVVAALLGHANDRMTQKHYAHLAPSYIAEVVKKNAPTFGFGKRSKVVDIGERRS
jgi:integrase